MFETERCSMRAFQKTDSGEVEKIYANPEVRKFLGGIRQQDAIKEAIDEMLNSSKGSYYWVVREKRTGDFIGLVSLDLHHEGIYREISYQLLPEWWGKGYATEVVTAAINFALNDLNLSTIVAETQTANTSSCKLLEKLGMQVERTVFRFGAEQALYSINTSKYKNNGSEMW